MELRGFFSFRGISRPSDGERLPEIERFPVVPDHTNKISVIKETGEHAD